MLITQGMGYNYQSLYFHGWSHCANNPGVILIAFNQRDILMIAAISGVFYTKMI